MLFAVTLSGASYAALQNTARSVYTIDIMTNAVIIWVGSRDVIGLPDSCNKYKVASCAVGSAYCNMMLSVAISAKMADKNVEFSYSGTCNGAMADVNRFRMMK